jgi:pentafunctional AROM polypeptide
MVAEVASSSIEIGVDAGLKAASYHNAPVQGPTGATIHRLSCLTSTIELGFHLLPHIAHTVLHELPSSTYVLITDDNLARLYLDDFIANFEQIISSRTTTAVRPRLLTKVIPPGEVSKSRETKAMIEDWLLGQAVTRDAVVVALGGGVIGDLVGFVAATFMRGLKFVQVPTTLLAMVDSSVGGKTAIDTPHGKNLIGAFHQPAYIFIDAAFLQSLPEREWSNGMAEVIKTAAIWDAVDFAKLEAEAAAIRSAVLGPNDDKAPSFQGQHIDTRTQAQTLLLDVIRGSIGVKAHIVNIDEKETGLRNLVNFGHSIGHAIEAVVTPDILHGECVSIGMILEAEIARFTHGLSQVAIGRLTRCLKEYNLPTSINDPRIVRLASASQLTVDRLLDIMRVDKKNAGSEKKIVLLSRIGGTVEPKASTVADEIIRRVLSAAVRVVPAASSKVKSEVTMSTPGSKSISNRALVLAALGRGTCRLRNLLHSDDTQVMMAGLGLLDAAKFDWENGGETIVVEGNEGRLKPTPNGKEIYLQNAGTAARFMTTVCTLLSGDQSETTITGNKRMKERPIGALVTALRSNGCGIQYKESDGCLPLIIKSTGLRGGRIELAASISSQYVSSILLCAPYAQQEVVLDLVGGAVISQPYIDMTIAMMADFGIKVERLLDDATGKLSNTYRVPLGCYVNPADYDIESDASSATYPLALAAILGTQCTVANIGSASLQGDARFAKAVLQPMGCHVQQSSHATTVTGPSVGHLKHIGTVDMEPMTDAFLTASVLLAVAQPTSEHKSTRITGIANQRVKECNRIRAMIDELAKFGVKTVEHEDGLEIFGIEPQKLRPDVSVHCYDDHRVAMAFSVLASVVPGRGCIIEEKRCVEKTWPNWWDDLEGKIGIQTEGVDLSRDHGSSSKLHAPLSTLSKSLTPVRYPENATIFCIGMRASGKTYLGKFGAAALRRPFLDADVLFNERYDLNTFVKQHGWPAFRKLETEMLQELMETKSHGYLVSLGGGVCESPQNRKLLRDYAESKGPVVYVVRDIDEVVAFLETSDRPAYGEPVREVAKRRQPWFYECSSYELVSYSGDKDLARPFDVQGMDNELSSSQILNGATSHVKPGPPSKAASIRKPTGLEAEVSRFFRFIANVETNRVQNLDSRRTYFVSLTYPDLRQSFPLLDDILQGADAIEVRVDLLHPSGRTPDAPHIPSAQYVSTQLAALRQRTGLPIVFSVRTKSQGGMFPDEAQDEYFEMIKLGLRCACEYIDLELQWPADRLNGVKSHKGHSMIVASHHDWSGAMDWNSPTTFAKYQQAARVGDVAKIVGKATGAVDNWALEAFRAKLQLLPDNKPLLAINMGEVGQASRILNPVLSPITHDALPFKAAPGQLTYKQIQQSLHLLGLLPAQQFALLGTPISHSLSPCLHNTAFEELGLPHHYGLLETTEANDARVIAFIRSPLFGGASVTMPHKLAIMPLLDVITPQAKVIGAVNTITPLLQADGRILLEGDNTDWIAIKEMCSRNLSPVQLADPSMTALVIGAGGSARAALYAMHVLGAQRILLFNRTTANAQSLADEVPKEWKVEVVTDLQALPADPIAIVSNVPSTGTRLDDGSKADGIVLPSAILAHPKGGVAIEMSYKPLKTPLTELVRLTNDAYNASHTALERDSHNLRDGRLWTGITGVTIVLEQGCHQFRKWTQREAPRVPVENKAWEQYLRK